MVQFFHETSLPFCFILPGLKFSPGLYNFPDTHTVLTVTSPTYVPHIDMLPVYPSIHATYIAFLLRKHLHPVYLRKQVDILLFYPCNPCGISAGTLFCLPRKQAPILPCNPCNMQYVKGIYLSLSNSSCSCCCWSSSVVDDDDDDDDDAEVDCYLFFSNNQFLFYS